MIRKNAAGLILSLVLVVPPSALAQGPPESRGGPGPGICGQPAGGPEAQARRPGPQNPIRCLMEREELALDEDQANQLQALAQELDEKNAPLMERLSELRPEPGEARGDRQEMRQRRRDIAPIREEIRGNTMAAFARALQLLDDEQRATVERAMRPGRRPRGHRGGPGSWRDGGSGGAAMMRRGSMLIDRGQRMMMRGAILLRGRGRALPPGGGG